MATLHAGRLWYGGKLQPCMREGYGTMAALYAVRLWYNGNPVCGKVRRILMVLSGYRISDVTAAVQCHTAKVDIDQGMFHSSVVDSAPSQLRGPLNDFGAS